MFLNPILAHRAISSPKLCIFLRHPCSTLHDLALKQSSRQHEAWTFHMSPDLIRSSCTYGLPCNQRMTVIVITAVADGQKSISGIFAPFLQVCSFADHCPGEKNNMSKGALLLTKRKREKVGSSTFSLNFSQNEFLKMTQNSSDLQMFSRKSAQKVNFSLERLKEARISAGS